MGYVDISASKLKVFNQGSIINTAIDIDLVISRGTTKFSEHDSELLQREYREYKKAMQTDFREVSETVRDLSNLIDSFSSTGVLPAQYRNLEHPEI